MAGVVWPSYHPTNVRAAAADKDRNVLGKDDFLHLLVTQLRNQNPLEPLSNTEYIAQMAQFTSVEQLMNLVGEMSALRHNLGIASSLIGKSVEWTEMDPQTGQPVTRQGIVDSIVVREGEPLAKVGDQEISLSAITSMSLPGGGGTDG
ncbi:MAG: flagellar hook capping protein [Thermobacillus sp.]|uniref:flagellar hook capping FlgD N-terminal domain-containing protein n=1 Tax=Thermobacillus sp. TaxID=2108467 RepID=UPI000E36DEB4|nr:flagellar hook capping FlgD N-terminal domain-containing protein [Thermobacillus sp.]REK57903.1 MAG: flagellar hook capping protein [Thermobacillus sp.]